MNRATRLASTAPRLTRATVLCLLPAVGVGAALAGCGGSPSGINSTGAGLVANPSKNEWPEPFRRASPEVQEAYRYALANRDVLQYMPCFCGCGTDGHRSNYDCYVREARADGSYVLDAMSFG